MEIPLEVFLTVPPSNVDIFRHKPVNEVSALLPNEQSTVAACEYLYDAGFDVTRVQILRGEEGARILDKHGTQHGYAARLVRILQNLGIDENALDVYDEALRNGETLITIPCASESARDLAYLLRPHGGHAMIYWGKGTRELLSAP
jgi:hypothetical protein